MRDTLSSFLSFFHAVLRVFQYHKMHIVRASNLVADDSGQIRFNLRIFAYNSGLFIKIYHTTFYATLNSEHAIMNQSDCTTLYDRFRSWVHFLAFSKRDSVNTVCLQHELVLLKEHPIKDDIVSVEKDYRNSLLILRTWLKTRSQSAFEV